MISIGNVIGDSFQIVFRARNRVLWVLGLIVALLAGGISINTNYRTNFGPGFSTNPQQQITAPDVNGIIRDSLIAAGVGLLIGLLFLLLRPSFEAGLIIAADGSARDAPPAFGPAWTAGRARMWPILGLDLLLGVVGVLLVAVVLVPLLVAAGSFLAWALTVQQNPANPPPPPGSAISGIGIGFLLVCCLGLIALPIWIVCWMIVQLAQRAVALDGQGFGAAFGTGWRLLRTNLGNTILVAGTHFLVTLIIGFFVSLVVGVLVGLPFLAAVMGGTVNNPSGLENMFAPLALTIALVGWLVRAVIMAIPTAWAATLWTIFYRAITAPVAPVAARYPGAGPESYGPTPPPPGYGPAPSYPTAPPPTYPGATGGYGPTSQAPLPGGYTVPGQYPGGEAPPNPYAPPARPQTPPEGGDPGSG